MLKNSKKAVTGMNLHKQIALGKKPSTVQVTKGVSPKTVNNIKKK